LLIKIEMFLFNFVAFNYVFNYITNWKMELELKVKKNTWRSKLVFHNAEIRRKYKAKL